MAIIDDLNNLQANILTAKQVLADNISSKGVGVSSKDTLTSLANSVSKIEQGSGGSGQWVLPKYIKFGYSSWDTISDEVKYADWSNVTNMSYMFYNNNILSTFDLNDIVTSKVTDMSYMFYNCTSLKSLDLSSFNTSNVSNMSYMFYNCTSLTSSDLSSFNTSNVTNISNMFRGCRSLTSLDLSNWDTSNVSSYNYIFYGCTTLTSLDLSNWDTSNVSSYSSMFTNCKSLSEIKMCNCSDSTIQFISDRLNDAGILDNVTIITECESNNEVISLSCDFDKSTPITDLYIDMDNLPEEEGYWWVGFSYNPNQEGDCNNCNWSNGDLKICLYENRYDGIIMNGEITQLEQVNGLYHLHLDTPLYFKCGEENSHLERYYLTPNKSNINISLRLNYPYEFNLYLNDNQYMINSDELTDNGDNTYTFTKDVNEILGGEQLNNCTNAFSSINTRLVELISFPITSNVDNIGGMFMGCGNITSLDLSYWDTSQIWNMRQLFYNCSSLTSLDLSNWTIKDDCDTDSMFNGCDNLREIYLKNSDNATYMKIQEALNRSGINAIIITE